MRISIPYLKNFLDIPHSTDKIIQDLTLNGLEVEAVFCPYKDIDDKLIITDIISVRPHPSNPELSIVDISDGKENISVVCGAKNVRSGPKAVWAPPGSKVAGYEIREKDFRGVKSPGMLLSLEELGLEEKSDGIWLFYSKEPAGTPLTSILRKDTQVIEINITPNRGDALSHLGVARELSAYYNLELRLLPSDFETVGKKSGLTIEIKNQKLCPLYQGTFADKIVIRESDIHIQKLLIESGLRPINNIVDLSNFVMLETGHPNHTFDFSYIKGGRIIVREAIKNEKIKLLNGSELTLSEKNLLICDESSPVALAGVMGGEYSSILMGTSSILLECAIFDPDSIRLTTSMHNISSDSSYRFARGVSPATVDYATKRFMHLLKREIPGAVIYDTVTVKSPDADRKKIISFRYQRAERLLGKKIDKGFINQTLKNLGIEISESNADSSELIIPPHRYDISVEEDIVEEIARIYGYNNFGLTLPHTETFETGMNVRDRFLRIVSSFLCHSGLNQVINYTFISDDINSVFSGKEAIPVKNPIAQDMASMRKSLIPSLIQTAVLNINRQNKDVRIFELGKIFFKENEIVEREHLGILLSGRTCERIWANPSREFDFFDIKGIAEHLLQTLHLKNFRFTATRIPDFMHPGKSAGLVIGEVHCGILGELHPKILKKYDIKQNILIAEFDLEPVFEKFISAYPSFSRYSPYPAVDRDIALVLDRSIPSEEIIKEIESMNISIVEDISVFDLYEGKGIEEGKKSLGISVKYRSFESTLTDEEVEKTHSKIVDNLLKKFYAKLR